jgi:hypothetical protein
VPTKDDVRRLCLALENVVEDGDYSFRVGSRGFVWPYPERVAPKRPRVTRFDIFVVWLGNDADKQALLEGEPGLFFTTDHYNGYPAVIVRLDPIPDDRLTELIADAHAAALADSRKPRRTRNRTP